jgi:hypothetical protein
MTNEKRLKNEITKLKQECGPKAQTRTCQVLAEVVKWLRENGHGNVTLSAVNHLLGEKIKTETVITAAKD